MPSPQAISFAPALKTGDTIGVIATGAPLESKRFEQGVDAIEGSGFRVEVPLDPSRDYGKYENLWSNGSVSERSLALKTLLEDSKVKAIITARGGYGTSHLLPLLDIKTLQSNPKPIVGLSDATPLLSFQAYHAGIASIHGSPLGASFADSGEKKSAREDVKDVLRLLSDPNYLPQYVCLPLREGSAKGQLLVGNLSMLVGMLASPWDVDYAGKILVLEEVSEAPYKIHRMLSQLAFAGKFNSLAGLVFGRFAKCDATHGPAVEEVFSIVLNDILSAFTFPVYSGLELGHWGRNVPLALGCQAELNEGKLSILEAAVA